MAQLALGVVGAVIGFYAGGPVGAQVGFAAGSAIGAIAFAPEQDIPKVSDLKAPQIQYGTPIPRLYGSNRTSGSVAWFSDKRVLAGDNGGKGSPSPPTADAAEIDVLYLLAIDSEVVAVTRIWRNGELIWSRRSDSDFDTLVASAETTAWTDMTFLDGNPAQMPNPVIEATDGVGNVTAYRGRTGVLFEGLYLGNSGQLPLMEFECCTAGTVGASEVVRDALVLYPWEGARPVHDGPMQYAAPGPNYTTLYFSDYDEAVLQNISIDHGLTGGVPDYATVFIGFASNTQPRANPWSSGPYVYDGANLSDDPQYVHYRMSGATPDQVCYKPVGNPLVAWGGNMKENGASPDDGIAWWSYDASTGENYITRVVRESSPDLTKYDFINNTLGIFDPPSDPPAYIFGMQIINLTAERMPALPPSPPTWEFETGTFRILADIQYRDGVLYQNGLGPVLLPSDANYANQSYWDGLAADAVAAGTLKNDVSVPATVTTVAKSVAALAPFTPGSIDLKTIVEAEWARVADHALMDASELEGIPVRGFQSGGSVRGAFEALAPVFHFGAVCSDKLYMRLQGGASAATIAFADLAAGEGQASDEPFAPVRANDEEIAERFSIVFPNISDDYANGSETGSRGSAGDIVVVQQTNVVMIPAEAKALAETTAVQAGISVTTAQVSLTDYYARIEPTDSITVPDEDGTTYRMRVTRETVGRGVRQLELVRDDIAILVSPGITSGNYTQNFIVVSTGSPEMLMLDTPILRDVDDDPGFYVGAKGNSSGAKLFSSIDGITYTEEVSIPSQSIIGKCLTILGRWTGPAVFDESNSVTVDVGSGTLSSSTRVAMLNDQSINACFIGSDGAWEFCQFRTATMSSAGVYKLTGLLRGGRGTEWVCNRHTYSEKFILLEASGLRRVLMQQSEIGTEEQWKIVSTGQLLSAATAEAFTDNGVGLKPFSPCDIRVSVVASTSTTFEWKRRTRKSVRFCGTGGINVPLGEFVESYDVEILDALGAVVASDTVSTTTWTTTYSSGAIPSGYSFAVYQKSFLVGRGYAATLDL